MVPQPTIPEIGEATPSATSDTTFDRQEHLPPGLKRLDDGLAIIGVLPVFIAVARRMIWAKRNPTHSVPHRENRFTQDSVALVVASYLVGLIVVSTVLGVAGNADPPVGAALLAALAAQTSATAAALTIARRNYSGGIRGFLFGNGLVSIRNLVGSTLVVTLVAVGCCPLILDYTLRVIQAVAPSFEAEPHSTLKALHEETQTLAIVVALWFGAVVAAPVAEEVFFRGLIQTTVFNACGRRWMAIAAAAAAFAFAHFPNPETLPALFIFGLLLGCLYERTGSLAPVIVVHALFNLKTLVWDTLARGGWDASGA